MPTLDRDLLNPQRDHVYRFRVGHREEYAVLLRGATEWHLVRERRVYATRPRDHAFDHSWGQPVLWEEHSVSHIPGEQNPVRRVANQLLRFSVGNSGLHRDIQRAGYRDIRFALGDHPTEVYDALAAARVIDVTPTESLFDGVDVLHTSLISVMEHTGTLREDRDLLGVMETALLTLKQNLRHRALGEQELATRQRAQATVEALDKL